MHKIRSCFLIIPLKHLHTAAYGWNSGPRLEQGVAHWLMSVSVHSQRPGEPAMVPEIQLSFFN